VVTPAGNIEPDREYPKAMKRVAVIYSGRVQGVGFRALVRACARGLPVTGWVRNEPDGSVRLEAQGDETGISALREEIRRERGRWISGEDERPMAVEPGETGFEIRY